MQHLFRAGQTNTENGPASVAQASRTSQTTPIRSRSVQRAVYVEQARLRAASVSATLEAVEHLLRAGSRYAEDGSRIILAPVIGRAVQRAVHVDQTRLWLLPIRATESVQHLEGPRGQDAMRHCLAHRARRTDRRLRSAAPCQHRCGYASV